MLPTLKPSTRPTHREKLAATTPRGSDAPRSRLDDLSTSAAQTQPASQEASHHSHHESEEVALASAVEQLMHRLEAGAGADVHAARADGTGGTGGADDAAPDAAADAFHALASQLVTSAEDATRAATACTLASLTEADGSFQLVLELDGVSSLADAELHVGARQLELRLPHSQCPFVQPLPKSVDADAAMAKFHKKSSQLRLTLPLA